MNNYNNAFRKIIIIGAGIAGLSACAKLREYGFDPLILEGRNRIGGRIDTSFELGIPISRGAAWIHGDYNNPINMLAKRFNVNKIAAHTEKFCHFDKTGLAIPFDDIKQFNEHFEEMTNQAKNIARKCEHDISLADALSSLISSQPWTSIEDDLFQGKLNYFQGYFGADYQSLSALNWDQEEAWPGDNCFLTDTYQPIITGLAKDCSIQLNKIVTEIQVLANQVEVKTAHDTYHADAVLVTLPLGVLKKNTVLFNPPLPADKQQAIQRIGMGLFKIIGMKFPDVFWPKENQGMAYAQFDPSIPTFYLNLYSFMQQPILLGYCGGNKAKQFEKFSDEICIQKIMDNFRKVYGQHIPDPDKYFITHWGSDPFSYGAYSYVATGATNIDYDALAHPVSNRLFFAGEATISKYPATTHGAYLSGVREAERIKSMLLS